MVNFIDNETPLSAENLNKIQKDLQTEINQLKGTVLYEDSEGTSENITLNETVANFDYIDISFETNQNKTHTERVYTPNEKNLTVNIGNIFDPNGIYQLAVAGLKINGNYLEWTYNGYVNMPHGSTCFIGSNSYYTKIVSVIGYKN